MSRAKPVSTRRPRSSGIISPLWFQHPHPYTDPFFMGALMSQAGQKSAAPPAEDSYSDSYSSDDTRSPSPPARSRAPSRKPRAAIQKPAPKKKAPAKKAPAVKKAPVQFKTKNGKEVSFTPTGKRQQKKQQVDQPVPTQADEDNDMIIYSDQE